MATWDFAPCRWTIPKVPALQIRIRRHHIRTGYRRDHEVLMSMADWHFHSSIDRRCDEGWPDHHQHEERLKVDLKKTAAP